MGGRRARVVGLQPAGLRTALTPLPPAGRCFCAGPTDGIMRRRTALGLLAVVVLAACGAPPGPRIPDRPPSRPDDAVVVASFDFPESAILGELYAQALEGAGVPVRPVWRSNSA